MRVLVISDMTGGPGGVYTHILQLESLVSAETSLCILLESATRHYVEPSYRFKSVMYGPLSHKLHDMSLIIKNLDSTLADFKPDIVHIMNGSIKSNLGIREHLITLGQYFVTSEHFIDDSPSIDEKILGRIRKVHEMTPCTIYVSEGSKDLALGRFRIIDKMSVVIHNGVLPSATRKKVFAQEPHKIYTIARCVEQKGIDLIIEALSKVNSRRLIFHVVGDGEKRAEYEAMALNLLGKRHEFKILGWKTQEEYSKMVDDYDLFVLASRQEGFSYSLLEVAAAGMPLLCSNARGNEELVRISRCGGLFEAGDSSDLARAVGAFIDNPSTLYNRARMGTKVGDILFNARVQVKKIEGLYFDIIQL